MNTKKEIRNGKTIMTKFTYRKREHGLIINTLPKHGKKNATLKNTNH